MSQKLSALLIIAVLTLGTVSIANAATIHDSEDHRGHWHTLTDYCSTLHDHDSFPALVCAAIAALEAEIHNIQLTPGPPGPQGNPGPVDPTLQNQITTLQTQNTALQTQIDALRCTSAFIIPSANLHNCDLRNFPGGTFSHADLHYANLSGANLYQVYLSGANLYGANLSGANLQYADLSGGDIQNANLSGANLSGANLSGANLQNSNLSGANLSNTNLSGTILHGTNLSGTDFTGCHGTPIGPPSVGSLPICGP